MRYHNCQQLQIFNCQFSVEHFLRLQTLSLLTGPLITPASLKMYLIIEHLFVSCGNRFPMPSHSGPFQAYCPTNWSNLANGSFESSNVTPRGPVYPSSQSFGNQNPNPYHQRNIHRSVKLPDIRMQRFDGDPLKWNEWISLFSSIIHNNQDITDTERMSNLQS